MTAYGRTRAIFDRFPWTSEPFIMGVEVGINTGLMSEDLLKRPNVFLYMVDNWKGEQDQPEHYKQAGDYHAHLTTGDQESRKRMALERTDFAKDRTMILHMDSVLAAKKTSDHSMDFVFIDGAHSYEGCLSDIEAWKDKVRPGGYLCGHDYRGDMLLGVRQAVDEAVAKYGWNLELDQDYTWFCKM